MESMGAGDTRSGAGTPAGPAFRILLVDDEDTSLGRIRESLAGAGVEIETVPRGSAALERAARRPFDLILIDPGIHPAEARFTLRDLRRAAPGVPTLLMATCEQRASFHDLLAQDTYECLAKPLNAGVVADTIDRFRRQKRLAEGCRALGRQIHAFTAAVGLVTRSSRMCEVLIQAAKVAPLPSTVLIEGESGTGKELVARAIHRHGSQVDRPFVALNCGALPPTLLETELFGHERGAFTGAVERKAGHIEAADGGTLFLDEIGEMGPELQVKLLRVLQERSFCRVGGTREIGANIRVIASTNRNLEKEVERKRFRRDLYYRINVVKIKLPPLRERPEDVAELGGHFARMYSRKFGRPIDGISAEAIGLLQKHRWQGNVRELQNVIERAVALSDGDEITPVDLPDEIRCSMPSPRFGAEAKPFQAAKQEFEVRYLEGILHRTGGNIAQASRLTAIPRQNLYAKLKKYHLDRTRYLRRLPTLEPLTARAV